MTEVGAGMVLVGVWWTFPAPSTAVWVSGGVVWVSRGMTWAGEWWG